MIYNNGNVVFTDDGNSVISPIGNRVAIYDLVKQVTTTLPFENRKNIQLISMSNSGRFLITVDVDGHALFINYPRKVILHRFNFKRKVYALKFAPNDEHFAVTYGTGVQIWQTPHIAREFAPLQLSRVISGHHDDVQCLDWSLDSDSIVMGAKDMTARVYYRVHSKNMALTVLSGHRDKLINVFFTESGNEIYSIAQDGAIFTWKFDFGERVDVVRKGDDVTEETEGRALTKRGGKWMLTGREFLWEPHTQVTSCDYNKRSQLLLVGFDKGVFSLFEMPSCVNLHKLNVSHQSINTVVLNNTGEWLALGSSRLGQLVVWEWKSESYILKQQGHLYGLNSVEYSSDGHYIATGGEDSKVKLWNTTSGFCFVTFSAHIAPVTGVKFFGQGAGKGVLSCSLDGTVRAHDLMRYKNFRTLTTPSPVQFTCLAVDSAGEIVCAGAMDPFQIYVWSLQTGRMLDVLSGHEGPIACLDFTGGSNDSSSSSSTALASGSWDGTLKLWNIYENTCTETFEHGCDVLACCFRPDGKEFCTCATNGCIYIWDVETGTQISIIEGRRDISGGRLSTDRVTADNSARSKYFTSVAYTADGNCILAAGRSKYCCIYSVTTGVLIKKFQLSHNRSLEGVLDKLRSDRMVDGVNLDTVNDSDDEGDAGGKYPNSMTPGNTGNRQDGSRLTKPEITCGCVCFSNTGTEWAAATTQGLQIFSLDESMMFAPTDIDITITPQAVLAAVSRKEFGLAINMALHLGEREVLKQAIDVVPLGSLDMVVLGVDTRMLKQLLGCLAEELGKSPHLEYYLQWCYAILQTYHQIISANSVFYLESLRSLIRVVTQHEKDFMTNTEKNQFMLSFIETQSKLRTSMAVETEVSAPDADSSDVESMC